MNFSTDSGLEEIEYNENYDMFSNRGSWPNPTPGALPTSPSYVHFATAALVLLLMPLVLNA